jgi:hypothetical protein
MFLANNEEQYSGRRFPLREDVSYRCLRGTKVLDIGVGKTIDMSKGEVRFVTERALRSGQKIEVTVNWPAMLDRTCRLKLVIYGHVTRSDLHSTAVRIGQYEFRTRAAKPITSMAAAS